MTIALTLLFMHCLHRLHALSTGAFAAEGATVALALEDEILLVKERIDSGGVEVEDILDRPLNSVPHALPANAGIFLSCQASTTTLAATAGLMIPTGFWTNRELPEGAG